MDLPDNLVIHVLSIHCRGYDGHCCLIEASGENFEVLLQSRDYLVSKSFKKRLSGFSIRVTNILFRVVYFKSWDMGSKNLMVMPKVCLVTLYQNFRQRM